MERTSTLQLAQGVPSVFGIAASTVACMLLYDTPFQDRDGNQDDSAANRTTTRPGCRRDDDPDAGDGGRARRNSDPDPPDAEEIPREAVVNVISVSRQISPAPDLPPNHAEGVSNQLIGAFRITLLFLA